MPCDPGLPLLESLNEKPKKIQDKLQEHWEKLLPRTKKSFLINPSVLNNRTTPHPQWFTAQASVWICTRSPSSAVTCKASKTGSHRASLFRYSQKLSGIQQPGLWTPDPSIFVHSKCSKLLLPGWWLIHLHLCSVPGGTVIGLQQHFNKLFYTHLFWIPLRNLPQKTLPGNYRGSGKAKQNKTKQLPQMLRWVPYCQHSIKATQD